MREIMASFPGAVFGWDDSHYYAHTEAQYTGIIPVLFHLKYADRSWWSIQQRRKPKMHHFQREDGEKAWNHPNLGASPSLAWMQREPGAWWSGAANAHTSQPPSVLKDGGHLGRLCRQKKRWISLDIVPLIGETWLLSGYIAKCFHKQNWEVVKSHTGWSMVYLWEENTRGSFGRYLQGNGSSFLHTLTLKQASSSIEGKLVRQLPDS